MEEDEKENWDDMSWSDLISTINGCATWYVQTGNEEAAKEGREVSEFVQKKFGNLNCWERELWIAQWAHGITRGSLPLDLEEMFKKWPAK